MYRHALVAIDLTEPAAGSVLRHARALLADDAELTVVHVVEPQYVQYSFDPTFTGSMIASLEAEARRSATRRVAELCEPFGIPEDSQLILEGRTAHVLHAQLEDGPYDLLIMGTHGRHGWRLMLGSTANALLHDTPVDMQVCRIDADT